MSSAPPSPTAFLDGDRAVAAEVGSPAAEQLVTMTLAEIRSAIAS